MTYSRKDVREPRQNKNESSNLTIRTTAPENTLVHFRSCDSWNCNVLSRVYVQWRFLQHIASIPCEWKRVLGNRRKCMRIHRSELRTGKKGWDRSRRKNNGWTDVLRRRRKTIVWTRISRVIVKYTSFNEKDKKKKNFKRVFLETLVFKLVDEICVKNTLLDWLRIWRESSADWTFPFWKNIDFYYGGFFFWMFNDE